MTLPASRTDIVRRYFEEADAGRVPADLFAEDFEFYFPKFGVGRGMAEFGELAAGMLSALAAFGHCRDELTFLEADRSVVVEGATQGMDKAGVAWRGGTTPGGRFCSIFDFDRQGLISRMFIYADPDYAGQDTERFYWDRKAPLW